MTSDSVHGILGFLQKKNRFYGWNKCLFLLGQHGLALVSSDPLPRTSKRESQKAELPFKTIGDVGGYDLRQIERIQPKQLIALSSITRVTAHGAADIVIATTLSGTLVLRAQTTGDRNDWMQSMQAAVASATLPDVDHDASLADISELSEDLVEIEASPA
ncbi:hypothetical protein IWW38_004709, partial [Coemansia aciculifera]